MKRTLLVNLFSILIILLVNIEVSAKTVTVGANTKISDVILAQGSITEPLIIELTAGYNQTSETIVAISGASSTNTVTIRPQAALSVTGSGATLWNLNGCKYVIIDGQANGTSGTSDLTLSNSSTSGITIQFINDASNNTVKYVNLKGVNSSITAGTVTFGTTTGTAGNDNNTIEHCNIGDGDTTPTFGVYSLGTATHTNDGNVISQNNIYNYYNSTSRIPPTEKSS